MESSKSSKKVVFSDVNIELVGNAFVTSVHEKTLNEHLCTPPKCAHPPEVIKGLICGHLFMFFPALPNANWNKSNRMPELKELQSEEADEDYLASILADMDPL